MTNTLAYYTGIFKGVPPMHISTLSLTVFLKENEAVHTVHKSRDNVKVFPWPSFVRLIKSLAIAQYNYCQLHFLVKATMIKNDFFPLNFPKLCNFQMRLKHNLFLHVNTSTKFPPIPFFLITAGIGWKIYFFILL